MASNHKLTNLLKGRRVKSTSNTNNKMTIHFDDDSVMTIHTAGSSNSGMTGGTVKAVRQQDTDLHVDFDEGSTLSIKLAEATSSVMVRNKDEDLEYAD